ncbi:putative YhdH/YhfP family quinone oxidoreductase [Geothermobacter ehrlichii]|uniref:Putative YhdH/YhfP family quinone oxidoreductase n=1 Tax=Geothermobacter ehrlichii TaxID=213224 RepID=A0A5D3WLS9_9BACT|nr:YhdH/YhfP family quinone oxidoreductase [Geothermobacter ehrlichii]TYO98222.1 putative YhdH/YhfP family quinone oxidoreductase [Geothermobacter ehrlichii]
MSQIFKAFWVEEVEAKKFSRSIVERSTDDLPPGELLVRVRYSSLNYKDALSSIGNRGVTRKYPHTPGIDAVGEVVSCSDGAFEPGAAVLVTGRDLGMNTPGGFGQYIRVPSDWALPLPTGLNMAESMMLGTAGLTAGLSVQALLDAGLRPDCGDILVTGATGGVGSLAIPMLAAEGFRVVASTGKESEHAFLRDLGAAEVISRSDVLENADRPLLSERWGGVVDCVGGSILAAALKATRHGGAVTCCGLVASPELHVNVFPFILRGVSLLGIDSVEIDRDRREQVWGKLAGSWKPSQLADMSREVGLDGLQVEIDRMLQGQSRGRVLVNLDR